MGPVRLAGPVEPGSHGLPPSSGTRPGKPGKPGTDGLSFDLPTPTYPGLDRQPLGSGTQPVPNYTFDRPTPTYLGPDRQPPGSGTQPVNNQFPPELSPRAREYDSLWSTEAQVTDSMTHLQLEVRTASGYG